MKDYKRFTKQLDKNFYIEDCRNCPKNWCCGQDDDDFMCREAMRQTLGELEDKIEQGLILELPMPLGCDVYLIVDGEIKMGVVAEILFKDVFIIRARVSLNGVWHYIARTQNEAFLTKAEAEAYLQSCEVRND